MTVAANYYYVCDCCGGLVTVTDHPIPEGAAWSCTDCGGRAVWEFTNRRAALEHSQHIMRGVSSGLFRRLA